jgi:broad specificity phosphatase PhoE
MGLKVIYFIRHGETLLNAKGIRQGPDGPLSDKGRQQVQETAKKFPTKKGKPRIIISSPFERAKETASILSSELKIKKVIYSDLLVERKNPSQIVGHQSGERDVQFIVDKIDKSFHEDNLKFSDEENFVELRNRADKLLRFLSRRSEKQIIAVTHGIFLKMVIAHMLYRDKLTASVYNTLSYLNPMDNAALTICTCKTRFLRRPIWKLIMWNNVLVEDGEEKE